MQAYAAQKPSIQLDWLKSPKDQPHFPSHPLRKTTPPKGELRWIEQGQIWKLVED
jgi:hypothetical protein